MEDMCKYKVRLMTFIGSVGRFCVQASLMFTSYF